MYLELANQNYHKVHMGPARFALDLSDGSERGEYVNQDYILSKLGRPHRAINLMYCYYPLDKTWPARARNAFPEQEIEFQWDYPYDDYFPYLGGIEGNRSSEPFQMMRDIRKHGQDVVLTLTIDPGITDEQLYAIANDLKGFGRMQLRINHEATGNWFTFNKRYSYQQVADFFVHATQLIHEIAPQIQIVLCIGGVEDPDPLLHLPLKTKQDPIEMEDIFKEAVTAADIWSVDKYMALHWGWPCDIADDTTDQYKCCNVKRTYDLTKLSYERYRLLNNHKGKPMVMSEFNADGDVVGPYEQIQMMQEFFELREKDSDDWLTAITFYQFRDRGRLGLEIEDPNNANVGIEQPILKEYRKLLHSPLCQPVISDAGDTETANPLSLRWGSSEDATGIQITLTLEKAPVFLELYFDEKSTGCNLMIQCNERWFYKAAGTTFVDLMPLFFEYPDSGRRSNSNSTRTLMLTFFAPPASGENEANQGEDWMVNYYTTLPSLPKLRIEYEPVLKKPEGMVDARNIF